MAIGLAKASAHSQQAQAFFSGLSSSWQQPRRGVLIPNAGMIGLRVREIPTAGRQLKTTVSLPNDEVRTLALGRVGTDPHGGCCRLNEVLHINVPEG